MESGFLRIHWQQNQTPDWFSQAQVQGGKPEDPKGPVVPTQDAKGTGAGASAAGSKAGPNVAHLKKSLGGLLTFAAFVLFCISVSSQEWVSSHGNFAAAAAPYADGSPDNTIAVLGLRRGLFQTCATVEQSSDQQIVHGVFGNPYGDCQRLDGQCHVQWMFGSHTFSFDEGVAGKSNCDQWRAVRAFALLAVFFSFVAAWVQSSHGKHSAGKKFGGFILGLTAGIFGMIAFSMARENFGEDAIVDFGVGFWTNVIAWVVALVGALVYITGQNEKSNFDHLATFVSLLAFIFLIVAVTTNELGYSYSYSLSNYNWNATGGQQGFDEAITHTSAWFGLWQFTVRQETYATSNTNTWDINSYCDVQDQGIKIGGCDELRTIRGLLIWAVIQSFLTFVVTATLSGDKNVKTGKKFLFALGSNFLVCGLLHLVISLIVDYFNTPATDYGFSFWLIILAFAFNMIQFFFTAAGNEMVHANFRLFFAWMISTGAAISYITAVAMTQWVVLRADQDVPGSTFLPLFNDAWSTGFNQGTSAAGFQGNQVTFGLWRFCADNACASIQTDTYCTVDGGLMSDFNDCHYFNAFRAFATITAVLGVIYKVKLTKAVHCALAGKEGECKEKCTKEGKKGCENCGSEHCKGCDGEYSRLTAWGWAVVISALTTTALGTSYFDLRAQDYGYSFWLFLVAWVMQFLATVYLHAGSVKNEWVYYGKILTLIFTIFFIIAAASQNIIRADVPNGNTDRFVTKTGYFYWCYKSGEDNPLSVPLTGSTYSFPRQRCYFVDRNCHFDMNNDNNGSVGQCGEFNGIRALGVLTLFFSAFSHFGMHGYEQHGGDFHKHLGTGASYMTSVLGMLTMALILDYYSDVPSGNYGYSFWLLVIGWAAHPIAAGLFSCGAACGEKDGKCETTGHGHSHGNGAAHGHSHGQGVEMTDTKSRV